MAFFDIVFRSKTLNQDTGLNVIIPEDCPQDNIPTLYLLHGMRGNHTSWCRKTEVDRFANIHKIAIVCFDASNSFYTKMKHGYDYYSFFVDEVIGYTRKIFKLSHKREDTFICGYSMGGYGALRTALLRPDIFCAAGSLSGAVDIISILENCPWDREARLIWGDNYFIDAKNTDVDIFWIVDHFPKDVQKPKLYTCCGKEDSLFASNVKFSEFMKDKGFDFEFQPGEGIHDWKFWNEWIGTSIEKIVSK